MEQFIDKEHLMSQIEKELSTHLSQVLSIKLEHNAAEFFEIAMALRLVAKQKCGINKSIQYRLNRVVDDIFLLLLNEYPAFQIMINAGPERFFVETMAEFEVQGAIDEAYNSIKQQNRGTGR